MYEIAAFFEPIDIGTWAWRMFGQIAVSCLIIWAIAFILSRIQWSSKKNVILNIYFGWLVPLTLYTIFATLFLLTSATYYREMGKPLSFCVAYLLPIFGSAIVSINLTWKIRMLARKELESKGGGK